MSHSPLLYVYKTTRYIRIKFGLINVFRIKPTNNVSNPNATGTFGSMGSEGNVAAAIRACADLKKKMESVKEGEEGLAWMELVKRCYSRGIDLTGHHQ